MTGKSYWFVQSMGDYDNVIVVFNLRAFTLEN